MVQGEMLPLKLLTRYRFLLISPPLLYVMLLSVTWFGGYLPARPRGRPPDPLSQSETKHMAVLPSEDRQQHQVSAQGTEIETAMEYPAAPSRGRILRHTHYRPRTRSPKNKLTHLDENNRKHRQEADLSALDNAAMDYVEIDPSDRQIVRNKNFAVVAMDIGDHLDLPESVARVLHSNIDKNGERHMNKSRLFKHGIKTHNLTIWTHGTSLTLLYDFKTILEPLGFVFIERGQSPSCLYLRECSSQTKSPDVASDDGLRQADVILCTRPASVCNKFLSLGKPMIVYTDTRYDIGLQSDLQRQTWNQNLKFIAADSRSLVAVTNMYDMEYMRYYTGIEPNIIPPLCHYIHQSYSPSRKDILLYDVGLPPEFLAKFTAGLRAHLNTSNPPLTITHYSSKKDRWTPEELVQFPAIIYLPNQISALRFTEFFRMNIPLFVPSVELLVDWHMKYKILHLDTPSFRKRARGDEDPKHKPSIYNKDFPNPKLDDNAESLRVWLSFADMYSFLHAIHFKSEENLVRLYSQHMLKDKFPRLSAEMGKRNEAMANFIRKQWTRFLDKLPPK